MSKSRIIAGNLGTTSGEGGGGVTTYDSDGLFPSSGNSTGDFAFDTNKKALYTWDGAEWDRVYNGPNEVLEAVTTPGLEISLSGDSATHTFKRSDPDNFPITYDFITNPIGVNGVTNGVTITNDSSQYTFVQDSADRETEFSIKFRATDGVHYSTFTSTVTVATYNGYADYYIARTSGSINEITPTAGVNDSAGASFANAYDLNSTIDALPIGDALLLKPGHYKITVASDVSGYAGDMFRNRCFALVGKAFVATAVKVTIFESGTSFRDNPIFLQSNNLSWISGWSQAVHLSHNRKRHLANLTIVRDEQSTSSYSNALVNNTFAGSYTTYNLGGGYAKNCIFDIDNNGGGTGNVSWQYDNNSQTNPTYFQDCSFVNYNAWDANYAGVAAGVVVGNAAMSGTTQTGGVTITNYQQNSNFTSDYTSYDNATTYGHLANVKNLTAAQVVVDGSNPY